MDTPDSKREFSRRQLLNVADLLGCSDFPVMRAAEKQYRPNKRSKRGWESAVSTMIGVSRNGKKWQAVIKDKKKKRYIGLYADIEEAGRAFDKETMLMHGTKARTNFDYTREELFSLFADIGPN